jgi:L-serine dehydratase
MAVSVFDLFKIGIGPSSSHTVGPMRAARQFALRLAQIKLLGETTRVECRLYGSLGATGKGHASDVAVLLGLLGCEPDTVEVDSIPALLAGVRSLKRLNLLGQHTIDFATSRQTCYSCATRPCPSTPTACASWPLTPPAKR